MMPVPNHLKLRLLRLNPSQEWSLQFDGFGVVLVKAGAGVYTDGSAAQRLATGDVLVVNGAGGGRLNLHAGTELAFWWFSLQLDQFYPLFAGGEISVLETVADSFNQPRHFPSGLPLARQCHRLVEEVPPQYNLEHRSQLLRVASVILSEEFKTAHEQHASALGVEANLVQIFEQLSTEELLHISVGDLAARFRRSRRQLNRLFHQYFGLSVVALRMELRLRKATSLLRNPDARIIHVADECGFHHLGLFNVCFKRRFGVNPSQWRKRARAQTKASLPGLPGDGLLCTFHANGQCPFMSEAMQSDSYGFPLALRAKSLHHSPQATR
jgi:AraC-like DNA-binding protein